MSRSITIGAAVTVFCLWFSFRHVHWSDLVKHLHEASYSLVVVSASLYLLSYAVRAFLWKELLGPKVHLDRRRLFQHLMLGVMANNILPARLGEVVRCYMAAKDARISQARVFSTIFVERSLDVVCLFGLTTIAFFQDFSVSWPTNVAFLALVLLLLILGFLFATMHRGHAVSRGIARVAPKRIRAGIYERLDQIVSSFLEGLPPRGWNQRNLSILGYSLGCWFVWVFFLFFALQAFNIKIPVSGVLMLSGIINLGVLAPSAPGFIGPFQFVCLEGLGLFGILPEKALAFSIVFHASWYLPSTILGVLFFLNIKMRTKTEAGAFGK